MFVEVGFGVWGWGFGDWGLGMGDWAQSPIPNPKYQIPNPQSPFKMENINKINNKYLLNNNFFL